MIGLPHRCVARNAEMLPGQHRCDPTFAKARPAVACGKQGGMDRVVVPALGSPGSLLGEGCMDEAV